MGALLLLLVMLLASAVFGHASETMALVGIGWRSRWWISPLRAWRWQWTGIAASTAWGWGKLLRTGSVKAPAA